LAELQKFLTKSQKVDELFKELSLENELYLDVDRINEIRERYDLSPVYAEEIEVKAFPFELIPTYEEEFKQSKINNTESDQIQIKSEYGTTFKYEQESDESSPVPEDLDDGVNTEDLEVKEQTVKSKKTGKPKEKKKILYDSNLP
jgi:hypothetical protein